MARFTSRLTTVKFLDGGSPAAEIVVGPGPGDLSIGETNADNAERIRVLDRGTFDGFVVGDDLEQDVSLTIEIENQTLTDGTDDRIRDFVMKTGTFASATSVNSTVWAFRVQVTMDDGTNTATITLPVVQGGVDFSEAKEGSTMSFSGTNNGTIAIS
tara:strand:+ start:737 stop:1207 length:471 start_codon:yes stop_codon:yes gene_type:complete